VPGHGAVEATLVSMGNPHAVVLVDDVDAAPLVDLGPALQRLDRFAEGTNVEVVQVTGEHAVRGRIWERGVGETLASGTGASAMAVAAAASGRTGRQVDVHLQGGVLAVDWGEDTLRVTGPAVEVGLGRVDAAWLAAALQRGR
jgi:diaminopimelate epimerase